MKILLDTNILLDLLDPDRRDAKTSQTFFDWIVLGNGYTPCVYIDALSTISFIISGGNIDTFDTLERVIEDFEVIDAMVDDAKMAIKLHRDGILHDDFEDGQLLAAALRVPDIGALVTNDKKFLSIGESIDEVDIISPSDALIAAGYRRNLMGEWDPADRLFKTLVMQVGLNEEKENK